MTRILTAVCCLAVAILLLSACNESFESSAYFYVQLEKKLCDAKSSEKFKELWAKCYAKDDTTFQYFKRSGILFLLILMFGLSAGPSTKQSDWRKRKLNRKASIVSL